MKFSKNVVLSIQILAAHRLRTILSVFGLVVGLSAVILMVAAGQGAQERILQRIRDMGTDLIVVNAGQTRLRAGRSRQRATVTTLLPGDATAIAAECPSVALAAPSVTNNLTVRWEDETANTTVRGATSDQFTIRNFAVARGRIFTEEEDRARRRVAVLGPTVVRNLFRETDPVGLRIRVGRVAFEVIGVTAAKGIDENGADQDDVLFVPLGTAMRRLLNVAYVQSIYAQANDSQSLLHAESEIRELLRARHRLSGKPDDFTIQNQAMLLATERDTSRSMTLLTASVAGISLLVGGVGVLAVMLISVHERTMEIGLRRALGARRRDIRTQFLMESGMLGGAGGLIGVVFGVCGAALVSTLGYWDTVILWPVVWLGFVFSLSLGIMFGLYPATRAASLEPIQALRTE